MGRKNNEGDPVDTLQLQRVCTEFFIELEMRALTKQIEIEIRIRSVETDIDILSSIVLSPACAQPVAVGAGGKVILEQSRVIIRSS